MASIPTAIESKGIISKSLTLVVLDYKMDTLSVSSINYDSNLDAKILLLPVIVLVVKGKCYKLSLKRNFNYA